MSRYTLLFDTTECLLVMTTIDLIQCCVMFRLRFCYVRE